MGSRSVARWWCGLCTLAQAAGFPLIFGPWPKIKTNHTARSELRIVRVKLVRQRIHGLQDDLPHLLYATDKEGFGLIKAPGNSILALEKYVGGGLCRA